MVAFDEDARLDALHRLNLLDTPPSESFDRITRMAAQIFSLPVAAVSLTDHDRQWFKSRVGVDHQSIPRDKAPCAAVAESRETLLVPDLLADDGYRASHLARQGIRFYAGAPLTTSDGYSLGALCVLGTEPREASTAEVRALEDLAAMVMAQIELQHAFGRIDPLSGLPNRTQFLGDVEDLGREHPGARRLAVVLDIARNDQIDSGMRVMGAAYLDEIVRETARFLSRVLGADRIAYHVGATLFAFLAPPDADEAAYLDHLRAMLARVTGESRERFVMTTAIGVAPFVAGVTDPRAVLRTAHSAAQDARNASSLVEVYSPSVDCAHQRRFRLLTDFRQALDSEDELFLVFQPRIDLGSGRCAGAEALLRWRHPTLGMISPAEFIPIVEQTALVCATTTRVLEAALTQLARWRHEGIDLTLSVNVSANDLQQPDFAQTVQLRLLKHRLPASALELEVTESAVMENVGHARAQLAALDDAGVRLAIDDFGTGYSSLAYLQQLPARVLKIDQSFVRAMADGTRDRTLVRSMIGLAHDLGYQVVAEGVETAAIRDMLVSMRCDEAQGYLFARPLTAPDFERWHAEFGVEPCALRIVA